MTVGELKEIINGIPDTTDIAIGDGENLLPICHSNSHLTCIEYLDTNEKIFVFVLLPCNCDMDEEDLSSLN